MCLAFAAIGLLATLIMSGCGKSRLSSAPIATVRGQLFGVVNIPAADIPDSIRPENVDFMKSQKTPIEHGYTIWARKGDVYEFRTTYPTDSLTITVGGHPATVYPDGRFEVEGVTPGNQEMVFLIAGAEARRMNVTVQRGNNDLSQDVVIKADCCSLDHHRRAEPHSTQETFQCLAGNGPGWRFYFSDCYVSLFYGPWQYRWMCWQEAMDRFPYVRIGNIWCNGRHTCSLWVHNWDWNAQRNHYHPWPWRPGSLASTGGGGSW